jgi:hypothetical protein
MWVEVDGTCSQANTSSGSVLLVIQQKQREWPTHIEEFTDGYDSINELERINVQVTLPMIFIGIGNHSCMVISSTYCHYCHLHYLSPFPKCL